MQRKPDFYIYYSPRTQTREWKSNMQSSWVGVLVSGVLNEAFQTPKSEEEE